MIKADILKTDVKIIADIWKSLTDKFSQVKQKNGRKA